MTNKQLINKLIALAHMKVWDVFHNRIEIDSEIFSTKTIH